MSATRGLIRYFSPTPKWVEPLMFNPLRGWGFFYNLSSEILSELFELKPFGLIISKYYLVILWEKVYQNL